LWKYLWPTESNGDWPTSEDKPKHGSVALAFTYRRTWQELGQVLLDRFPDTTASDPMDQLQLLKQNTTVNAYIDQYEQWMTQMKTERNYLPQDFFVDRFTSGLKDSIKHLVQCQKPETLLSAYWYARKYEQAYLLNVKKQAPAAVVPQPFPQQQNQRPSIQRDNRNRAPNNNRGPKLCWYCNEFFYWPQMPTDAENTEYDCPSRL
jgi:hypothetical protein